MAVSLQLPPIFQRFQAIFLILNNVVALALGPQRQFLRVFLTLPLLILLVAQSFYQEWDKGWGYKYGLEVFTMTMILQYVDWILLQSPDKEGWYKIQYGKEEDKAKASNGKPNGTGNATMPSKRYEREPGGAGTTFWSRMWWGIRLSFTNRYVGWSQQVKNVNMEVPPDYPRLHFIARKSVRLALLIVFRDLSIAYMASSPYGTYLDLQQSGEKTFSSFSPDDPFFPTRLWYTWVTILMTWVNLEIGHTAYGILCVALGLANPRDCPSGFGYLRDLWSVRQAWSAVWHQQMRRICGAPSLWLARDFLKLRKGSFGSKYVQLFGAFGISALIHSGGSWLLDRSFDDDVGSMKFFLGQAAVILVEDHIIALGKKMGFRDSVGWRLLGFVWTLLMVGWGTEGYFDRSLQRGLWTHDRTPDWFGVGPK
ncbi:uncharacterized protein yc1106_07940 [Curvularia clavata]|uniref:Wax synthase domain-containing protein n=1 Tax=Curvularia clavata TaxID=95742 RepID=A0A9Q8ZCG7_CURCL|nr:uncharacterized protein yc1106_07940 [Curvularia clavata]